MNDLGRRLDSLANIATRDTTLVDPSSDAPARQSPARRRSLLVGVVIVALLTGLFVWWQGTDSTSTSLVAAEGQDSREAIDDDCAIRPVLEVLRAGLPTFDYQPAGSYLALADRSEVVVSGRIVSAVRLATGGRDFIELRLADVTDFRGEARPDVDVIAYDAAWANSSQADPLQKIVGLNGVNFVGFLSPWSGVRGGWSPGPEGLYITCGDAEPLQPVLGDAAGIGDPAPVTLLDLRARIAASLLQAERDAERLAAEAARIAAQQAAARQERELLTDIAEARALWDAAAIGDYRFRYAALATMGTSALVDVLVEDGAPTRVGAGRAGTESTPLWTVDDLFEMVESADEVREALFDPVLGYPTQFSIDPDKTVIDEELSVAVTELFSIADIETAAVHLEAWFPEPVELPPALAELMERMNLHRSDSTDIGDAYLLYSGADLEVYLYRNLGDLCLVTATRAPASEGDKYGSMGAGCQSDTKFGLDGDQGGSSNDFGEESYLVVIPPARYITESWHLEVTAGRDHGIEMSERAAVVIFDEAGPQEDVVATVRCVCGDITYNLQLLANE